MVIHAEFDKLKINQLVVVRAEILPTDFPRTPGKLLIVTYYSQNSKIKKISPLKFWSILKGFDPAIVNFQEQKDFPPRDFDKSLQLDSCMTIERHRMKTLKFRRL